MAKKLELPYNLKGVCYKMAQTVKKNAEDRMQKATQALRRELATLRAGRANPSLLDRVQVDYYGVPTPVNQTANISTPDPRQILIQPWDKTMLSEIEKAILKSDLGLSPTNDGDVIRINIPMLTEERRAELVKTARKFGEESKVTIRNIRREANDEIKKLENKELSEDDARREQEVIQSLTDRYIAEIDQILDAKEKEIMEV